MIKMIIQFCHVNWEDIAEQKMQPPMLPYVQGPGDPSNFEEYDPEDPVTPDEVYDEEYLMVRPTYAYFYFLLNQPLFLRWNSVISNIHATLSRKFNKFKIKSCSMYSSM